MAHIQFTRFTSEVPRLLAKEIGFKDGKLTKRSAASIIRGTAERINAHDVDDVLEHLESLKGTQAVAWGITAQERIGITTQRLHEAHPDAIPRDRRHFSYSDGPGVLMLDSDGGPPDWQSTWNVDAFNEALDEVSPELRDAPRIIRPSSSTGIQAPSGAAITGNDRFRGYVIVRDARLIKAAGDCLIERLWSRGFGWGEIGSAGQILLRTIIDGQVWQPERLDFAGAPVLHDGLTREPMDSLVFNTGNAPCDLAALSNDEATVRRAQAARRSARAALQAEADRVRAAWINAHAPELARSRGITERRARDVLTRAARHGVLTGDYVLQVKTSDKIIEPVSVAEVLADPEKYHGKRCADPLGAHPEDDRIAYLRLLGGARPSLFSHAGGGMVFDLQRQIERIVVGTGMRVQTTDDVARVLRESGDVFQHGSSGLVHVVDKRLVPVSADWLLDGMGRRCEFVKVNGGNAGEAAREIVQDAPLPVAKALMARSGELGLKRATAIITAPTLRVDGSILDRPGFDEATGLLYLTEDEAPARVPREPNTAQAIEAAATLWEPIAGFPFVDDISRGVALQGMLTAAVRGSLPTAPGVGCDAVQAGSGKTLFAQTLSALADGTRAAVLPPSDDDVEVRKRLFAALREGARVILWDNVRATLGCASLDAFLTAPQFADRVLGSSETAALPNRAMFIATGNNLQLSGDTCRRVLVARMDAQMERPHLRKFEFDPAEKVLADRERYVVAALTIIRAYIAAGRPRLAQGRLASFEAWDELVRQPVCWLASVLKAKPDPRLPSFGDPTKAIDASFESDPESTKLRALLEAWNAEFGDKAMPVAKAIDHVSMQPEHDLAVALEEIAGDGKPGGMRINPRVLGRWIEKRQGRRLAGLRFVRAAGRSGVAHWSVASERAEASEIADDGGDLA